MICPNCQMELIDDTAKCTVCGHKFGSDTHEKSFSPGKTRAFQSSATVMPTKLSGDEPPMAATKVASSREEMGITKVHLETGMPPTKVSATQTMDATKIYGQTPKPTPFFGWLVFMEGKQQWQQFVVPLEEKRNTIGRGENADFRIDDDGCELIHASLRVREGKLFVTDLDTDSGTLVHDQPISRTELQDGDEIRIGSAVLRFRRL